MKTYGSLEYLKTEDKWRMKNLPPHVKIKLKRIFESIPKNTEIFYFDNTHENCLDIEWVTQRYPMKISKEDERLLLETNSKYRHQIEENEKILMPDYSPRLIEFKDGLGLRKFQQQAVDLFWNVRRLLIADEVGLGKTVTAIGAMTKQECLPALVVVQPHLTQQWKEQIEKFSNMKVHVMEKSKPYSLPEADVYICKYSNIWKWVDVLVEMPFNLFVLDEIQEVRRDQSKKHRACKVVSDNIEYVMGLSGTPIFNYGYEAWVLYNIIKPGLLGDSLSFRREWCGFTDKVLDPVALGSFLRNSHSYLRRTKDDVKSELPPVNKIVHQVGFDQRAIDKMESEAKTLALQVMQGSFVEKGQAARELSVMVRKHTGISKARDVANYVKMLCENGEKVLLAGWHRDVYDIWLEELDQFNPVMYTGSETSSQKQKSKQKFTEGDSQVMIISLRSGSGLDGLQGYCSYVVFGELDWTPAIHDQVIGRLYREGQNNQVTAIFLTTNSGSDPIVVDILGIKKSQSQGINDPSYIGAKQYSDDSIIKEFARKFVNEGK